MLNRILSFSKVFVLIAGLRTSYILVDKLLMDDLISTDDVMQTTYCEINLDKQIRDAFVYAIKNHYWYQMYIDDLPIWGKKCLLTL